MRAQARCLGEVREWADGARLKHTGKKPLCFSSSSSSSSSNQQLFLSLIKRKNAAPLCLFFFQLVSRAGVHVACKAHLPSRLLLRVGVAPTAQASPTFSLCQQTYQSCRAVGSTKVCQEYTMEKSLPVAASPARLAQLNHLNGPTIPV